MVATGELSDNFFRPGKIPLSNDSRPAAVINNSRAVAHEDKTHPGAVIASLSTPFGEQVAQRSTMRLPRWAAPDFYYAPWRCSPSATRICHQGLRIRYWGIDDGYHVVSCSQAL